MSLLDDLGCLRPRSQTLALSESFKSWQSTSLLAKVYMMGMHLTVCFVPCACIMSAASIIRCLDTDSEAEHAHAMQAAACLAQ